MIWENEDGMKVPLDSIKDEDDKSKIFVVNGNRVIEKESVVEEALKRIDPMSLSPLDALSTLIELKKLL